MGEIVVELADVRYRYPGAGSDSVAGVSLQVCKGELVGIVGPNGSGKTTLLRLLLGTLHAAGGTVSVAGKPIDQWGRRDLARIIGVVTQREEPAFPLTVDQAVFLGRYPHMTALGGPNRADHDAVARALDRCDVTQFRDRWINTLSGGEWQRVRVARALAQAPEALILDEPTASLDIRHEMEVFELVSHLVHRDHMAGVIITHHVNLAARFVDRVVVMNRGIAEAIGPPNQVVTREVLESVFRWPVEIHSWRGVPQFVPLTSDVPDDEGQPQET